MLCFVQSILIAGPNSGRSENISKDKLLKHKLVLLRSRTQCNTSYGIRSAPTSPMAPLQNQSEGLEQPVITLSTITRSPSHNNSSKFDSKSTKQINQRSVAASTVRSNSPYPRQLVSTSKNEVPEKEKKRKELSSSRQKKFNRHFQQVSKDERVLNYFSCALVSDILLQGHLYITDNYFAFYSNVFGFVTKLVIPTASVIKISKEKTAKIIPNAVGVATADERHVFGSFMSREAAFRLMCSVCQPLEPIESMPKIPDVEVSEECSVEDDSSCSISGNESPLQILDSTSETSHCLRQRKVPPFILTNNIETNGKLDIPAEATKLITSSCQITPVKHLKSPPPKIITTTPKISLKFLTDCHVVYLCVILSILLALLSGFLLYRILEMEARTNNPSFEIKWDASESENIYAKALKWQKDLQAKSTEEATNILSSNLEQIVRIRKSLETLSFLMRERIITPSHNKEQMQSNFDNDESDTVLEFNSNEAT